MTVCALCGRVGTRGFRLAWSSDGVRSGEDKVCTNDRACTARRNHVSIEDLDEAANALNALYVTDETPERESWRRVEEWLRKEGDRRFRRTKR